MSVYTQVERTELEEMLQGYDIGELVNFEGIGEGIDNTNYFVDTANGRWVLTLFERLAKEELPFFIDWMQHLFNAGVPAAKPIANKAGDFIRVLHNKPAVFFSFVKGKSLTSPTVDQCAKVGACLANMHLASQSFPQAADNPRGKAWVHEQIDVLLPLVDTDEAKLLLAVRETLDIIAWDILPQGIIHADLFKDNVLFEGDEVAGVIDFYDSCTGSMAYDLAIAYNAWCFDEDFALSEPRAEAFMAAYDAVRPLAIEEHSEWRALLAVAAARWWVGRLLSRHFPRAGDFVPEKNPKEMQAILEHHLKA